MNIRYGIAPETFKLTGGNNWIFNPKTLDDFSKKISIAAVKNNWAAFQVIVSADTDYALNAGESLWVSQRTEMPYVRLSADSPFETELNIIDMHSDDDRILKADALLTSPTVELKRNETRAVWVEMKIPSCAAAGNYNCKIKIAAGCALEDEVIAGELEACVEVLDYEMPDVRDYKFHLDLWQHSSNIARKHEVPLWSDAHFKVLEQYAKSLGELGQKAVTLIVSEVPWSGQSCFGEYRMAANLFEYSIIPAAREKDGRFVYDYSKMQKYIDICKSYGIDREISLYGLCNVWGSPEAGLGNIAEGYPDGIKIRYFDKTDGTYKYMRKACEIDDYISSLEKYFIETKQMDKVRLAADEPGDVEAYRKSLEHLMSIAPSFKFKAAINHSEFIGEFGNEVYDFVPYIGGLCSEYDKILEYKRTMTGKRFLWYVCCGPSYPNTFVGSGLLESYFIGVLTSYAGLDGFLRWNYTVWNDAPRTDIRYGNWRAGDTNFVYPANNGAPLLSLRYKALKRGIELYELLEKLKETGSNEAVEKAYGFVVREKDIRNYYKTADSLEAMCSLEYNDYTDMKRYIIENLKSSIH